MLFGALFLLNSVVFTQSLGDQAVSTPIQQLRKAFCLWHIHQSIPLPRELAGACMYCSQAVVGLEVSTVAALEPASTASAAARVVLEHCRRTGAKTL